MNKEIRPNETAQLVISNIKDELPFAIFVQVPEPKDIPPHAHILDSKTRKEIGAFVLTSTPPKTTKDLQPYKDKSDKHKGLDNISLTGQEAIIKWATKRNVRNNLMDNWGTLIFAYNYNYLDGYSS